MEMVNNQMKTYYWANKGSGTVFTEYDNEQDKDIINYYEFRLPPEFLASQNKKWIIVEECKATVDRTLVGDVILHATFIQRDQYLDSSVCFVNEEANRNTAKYEIVRYQPTFKLWFTDLNLNDVTNDIDGFCLRCLLIY